MAQYLDYAGLKTYHKLIKKYIDDNIGEITSFEYVIPDNNTLPTAGEKGKIYLIPSATQSGTQEYDEYIWIIDTDSPTGRFEFIGTTAMNLDGYLTEENAENTYVTKENAENTYAKKSEIPTDTNTTYTFANGTNGFTVTPSGGSAQTVNITPNIGAVIRTGPDIVGGVENPTNYSNPDMVYGIYADAADGVQYTKFSIGAGPTYLKLRIPPVTEASAWAGNGLMTHEQYQKLNEIGPIPTSSITRTELEKE